MKAIVAEIDKKQMIVITEKGDFIKVKRQMSATIGDEIQLKQQKKYLTYKRLAGVAACLIACIFLSTGVYAYYTPYSYVSVDINPSISLSLNRFERVISIKPLTDDAVSFIKDTKNLKNQNINDAISEIIRSASDKGYIDNETEDQIMIVVSAKNSKQEDKLEDTVNTAVSKGLSEANMNYGVNVEKTTMESYKTALSNKTSPGREMLEDKLLEVNPEIEIEELEDMSMKEIMKSIKEGRKAAKEEEKDNKEREKEERTKEDKNEDDQKRKGTEKTTGEGKSNKRNDEMIDSEAEVPSNTNEENEEKNEKVKREEEEKDKKEENKKKDEEDKDEDKNNNKKIEDKDKKNDNPKGKDNDNRRDSRGKDKNRAK